MRFASPQYLIIFLLIAAFIYIYKNIIRKKAFNPAIKFSQARLLKDAGTGIKSLLLKVLKWAKYLALVLVIIALARPQEGKTYEYSNDQGIDIMVVMDTSSSMSSVDFKPLDRMQTAKKVTEDFVKARKFDRVGLVIFSGLAFTQSPLTTDKESLAEFIRNINIGDTGIDGTAIGSAIMTAVNRLRDSQAKSKVIILVTDGNNNAGEVDPLTASKIASSYGIKIYTIGVGSREGGIYVVDDPFFGKREVRSRESALQEDALKQISSNTGGEYFRALDERSFANIMKQIDALEKNEIKTVKFTNYNELYKNFAFPAFILFLLVILFENTYLRRLP